MRLSVASPGLLFAYLAFVVYGSLVPLDFQLLPLDEAWRRFQQIPFLELGIESRADWVANGVLYLPLGFLAARALAGAGRSGYGAVVASTLFGTVIAVAVEFTQLYFPARTVSQNDLIAEFIGTLLGALLAPVVAPWLTRLKQALAGGGPRLWFRTLEVYAVAYVALSFFPYDLLLSSAELTDKFHSTVWGWLLAASDRGVFIVTLQLLVEVALCIPMGVMLACLSSSHRVSMRRAALVGLFLGLAIELGQFFIASGVSQGASVLTRSMGVLLGAAMAPHLAVAGIDKLREVVGRYGAWTLALYFPVLLAANGWFRSGWLGLDGARAAWAEVHLLPFYYHYFTTEAMALFSLGSVALMYSPLAVLCWARRVPMLSAATGVAMICMFIEASKLWLKGQHPDPTNVLIVAAVSALFYQLASVASETGALLTTGEPRSSLAPRFGNENRPTDTRLRGNFWLWLVVPLAWFMAARFPAFPWALTALLVVCSAAIWVRPAGVLVIIPAAMPVLDLAPLSGRLYWDEFDLLMTAGLAVAALRLPQRVLAPNKPSLITLVFAGLAVSLLLSTMRALWPLPTLDANSFTSYFSAFNALRIGKGALWAWLFVAVYQRLHDDGQERERLFGLGMRVGLAMTLLVILWERASFAGLLDFTSDYRVTGPFSAMHKGGAYIECYLAVGAAFTLAWLLRASAWPVRAAAITLLALTSYAMAVTYSRNGYAALLVVLLLGLAGLPQYVALGKPTVGRSAWRRWAMVAAAAVVVTGVTWPILSGGFARERLTQSAHDLPVRGAHWADALSLRDDSVITSVLGMGVGRFPDTHFWRSKEALHAPSLRLEQEAGRSFLRLGPGAPTYFEQWVSIVQDESLSLRLEIRSRASTSTPVATLCEKWMLTSARCETASLPGLELPAANPVVLPSTSANPVEQWRRVESTFSTAQFEGAGGWLARPIKFSLHVPTVGVALDVRKIELRSAARGDLLRNGDFAAGMDHWFFTTDIDPPWHIHSLPVAVLFDQGWLGVAAWSVVMLAALTAGCLRARQGSARAATAMVAVAGFLASASLNTLIDAPRFLWLLLVLLWLCCYRDVVEPGRQTRTGGPRPGPRLETAAP